MFNQNRILSSHWLVVIVLSFFLAASKSVPIYFVEDPPYPSPETLSVPDSLEESVTKRFLPLIFRNFTPPPSSQSYYIVTLQDIYNIGCKLGTIHNNLPGEQISFVFLDFGQPEDFGGGVYGTLLFDYETTPFLLEIQIFTIDVAQGHENCSPADTDSSFYIGVGLNSDGTDVTSGHGAAWADLVVDINSEIEQRFPMSNILAFGAINIEPGFNIPSNTRPWVEGYDSVSPRFALYIIGSADGCPINSYGYPGSCNNGWSQEEIYKVLWEPGPNWPIPEIYETSGVHAKQWHQIALFSYNYKSRSITFSGSTTQAGACQQLIDEANKWPFGSPQYNYWMDRWNSDCYTLNNQPAEGFSDL